MATAAHYRDLILKLLPRGKAWARDQDSWTFKFSEAMGVELARVDAKIKDLLAEIDPRKSVAFLTDFEQEYGLPDECSVLAGTIEGRREDILTRITSYGGQSEQYFIDTLAAAGVGITVTYVAPTRVGARAGSRLHGPGYKHVWLVNIPDGTVTYFIAGVSVAGDPLFEVSSNTNVVCFIDKNKPAHTYVYYTFS